MLEYPFSTPSRFKYGGDLTDHTNDRGQSAYDRWLELSGEVQIGRRTLRQRLERLIKSRAYQSLPDKGIDQLDVDSPKIQEIQSLIRKYRARALQEMLSEFPEISAMARQQVIAKSSMRQGVPAELVRAQLFPVE